jgi:hypothetical protein
MSVTTPTKTTFAEFNKTVTFEDAILALAKNDYAKFESFAQAVDQTPRTVAVWVVMEATDISSFDWLHDGEFYESDTVESIKADHAEASRETIEYRATVSRDTFGSEYDDNDEDEREAAEEAYERAARNVIAKMHPNADITIDIDFIEVGADSDALTVDGEETYPDLSQQIWDEMCGETWGEVRAANGLE